MEILVETIVWENYTYAYDIWPTLRKFNIIESSWTTAKTFPAEGSPFSKYNITWHSTLHTPHWHSEMTRNYGNPIGFYLENKKLKKKPLENHANWLCQGHQGVSAFMQGI